MGGRGRGKERESEDEREGGGRREPARERRWEEGVSEREECRTHVKTFFSMRDDMAGLASPSASVQTLKQASKQSTTSTASTTSKQSIVRKTQQAKYKNSAKRSKQTKK